MHGSLEFFQCIKMKYSIYLAQKKLECDLAFRCCHFFSSLQLDIVAGRCCVFVAHY